MSEPTPARKSFNARVVDRSASQGTRVCLGIDPRPSMHPLTHPDRFERDPAKVARAVVHYFQAIVATTSDLVACYKVQSAFFEALGIPGLIAMAQLLADIRSKGVPVILDGKRGDIDSTAEAYATAYLADGVFAADALTVNPYLGLETLGPFIAAAAERGRGVLVLLKTSNPGSGDVQDLRLEGGRKVWQHLAEELAMMAAAGGGPTDSPIGAVVGATYPADLLAARQILPRSLLLVPGYGTQGGAAEDIAAAFENSGPAVVNSSRALTYPSESGDFADEARTATLRMRDEINAAVATAGGK